MLGGDRFCIICFNGFLGLAQLVLENGAFGPPKAFVLYGFNVEMLFWLEVFGGNVAPVLGGSRFFNDFCCFDSGDRFPPRNPKTKF